MSAAETIAAAIQKLEYLAASTTVGPWDHGLRGVESPVGYVAKDDGMDHGDIDLIVTLHRTIDAQLAILRETQHWQDLFDQGLIPDTGNPDLALARAILGGAS